MKAKCKCGAEVRAEVVRTPGAVKAVTLALCPRCDTRDCRKCAADVPRDARRCPKCGQTV
jgi:ribosomal protein L40E